MSGWFLLLLFFLGFLYCFQSWYIERFVTHSFGFLFYNGVLFWSTCIYLILYGHLICTLLINALLCSFMCCNVWIWKLKSDVCLNLFSPVRDVISGLIMACTSVPQLIAYAETVGYASHRWGLRISMIQYLFLFGPLNLILVYVPYSIWTISIKWFVHSWTIIDGICVGHW